MGKHQGRLELTWTDKDKALLSSGDGKYDYTFADPLDPRVLEVRLLHQVEHVGAETPPDRPEDLPAPTTDNLLITGDAMHVLDALNKTPEYAAKYKGQVKLVYIDPPFNTGQTFDNYDDNIEHSIWLTMLRDRLKQIAPLLSEDASVWVHLDDMEVHRCRVVMDEELGIENFAGQITWEKADGPRSDSRGISVRHDTILVYGASPQFVPNRVVRLTDPTHFNKTDEDGRRYYVQQLRARGVAGTREARPTLYYPLTAPDGSQVYPVRPDGGDARWWWSKDRVERDAHLIEWGKGRTGDWVPYFRVYADATTPPPYETIWFGADVGTNRTAKFELRALFPGQHPFATPKPERLLARIIHIATEPGDLVLDCFAGSGTTAAVAHKMGRRWITSELLSATADTFTKPRLSKVLDGSDLGGVTETVTRSLVDLDADDGLTATEAQEFTRLLGKVSKRVSDLDSATLKALRDATRTRPLTVRNWHGGGAFTHLVVGPSMYEVDEDGDVFLSESATNGAWSQSIAAQLRFTLTPDHPVFCGIRNRQRLAVIDGVADEVVVRTVVENLQPKERAVIVAKIVLPGVEELLSELSTGSRIKKAPRDLFPKRTVK